MTFTVKSLWFWSGMTTRGEVPLKNRSVMVHTSHLKCCSKWQLHTQRDTHNHCTRSVIQEMSFAIFPLLVDSMDYSIKICKFIISQKPIFTSISLCHSNSVHSLPRLAFSILFCFSLVVYTFSSLPLPKPSTQQHWCRLVSSLKANCQP